MRVSFNVFWAMSMQKIEKIRKISGILAVFLLLGCTREYFYEMPPERLDCPVQEEPQEPQLSQEEIAALEAELATAAEKRRLEQEERVRQEALALAPVDIAGVKICPNNRRCSDEALLPAEPCLEPMPKYYGGVSDDEISHGIQLIHPLTRQMVLCFDDGSNSAEDCVYRFKAEGYVLTADVPQFAAQYDFLQKGGYPTRRWRKGENIPRY